MDLTTICQFKSGIRQPKLLFKTLCDMVPEFDSMHTTKHFCECRITLNGGDYLIYAPINYESMGMVHRAIESLNVTNCDITDIRILEAELLGCIASPYDTSIVIETLPEGTPLSEALYTLTEEHLLKGLNRLRQQLMSFDISINNLTPENIIIGYDFEWYVTRSYMITQGYGRDDASFSRIERLIEKCSLQSDEFSQRRVHMDRLELHRTTVEKDRTIYPLQDGCRRFVTRNGVGFLDDNNNVVIEPVFKRASNFREDRSVVTTNTGHMGVIDRRGHFIVPPIYEHAEFNVDSGNIAVSNGNMWAVYDYLGELIKDWHERKQYIPIRPHATPLDYSADDDV